MKELRSREERLLDAIGQIDDDILLEAYSTDSRQRLAAAGRGRLSQRNIRQLSSLVACLLILSAALVPLTALTRNRSPVENGKSEGVHTGQLPAVSSTAAPTGTQSVPAAPLDKPVEPENCPGILPSVPAPEQAIPPLYDQADSPESESELPDGEKTPSSESSTEEETVVEAPPAA